MVSSTHCDQAKPSQITDHNQFVQAQRSVQQIHGNKESAQKRATSRHHVEGGPNQQHLRRSLYLRIYPHLGPSAAVDVQWVYRVAISMRIDHSVAHVQL